MRTIDKTKRWPTNWEKIFANDMTNKGLICNIYKQLIQLKKKEKEWAEKLNRHFSKEEMQTAKKRCSTSLITREMQIRTIMRYHLTPVRTVIIKRNTNNKCWWECGEKGILVHHWWRRKFVWPLVETIWRLLKKLKTELPYDPATPLLGIFIHPKI